MDSYVEVTATTYTQRPYGKVALLDVPKLEKFFDLFTELACIYQLNDSAEEAILLATQYYKHGLSDAMKKRGRNWRMDSS